MKLSPTLKKYITIGMVAGLPSLCGIKKIVDHNNSHLLSALKIHNHDKETLATDFVVGTSILTPQSENAFAQIDHMPDAYKSLAYDTYKSHHLPVPDYCIRPDMLPQMTENRISATLIPRHLMMSGIDEYKNGRYMQRIHKDICLTASLGEVLRMKIRNNLMYARLGQTGKKVRTTGAQLRDIGWKGVVPTRDALEYFDTMAETKIIPDHYRDILRQAQYSQGGDLLMFRNAESGNIPKARSEGGQNATHVVFSHGRISQQLSTVSLGISSAEYNLPDNSDKKTLFIYKLMTASKLNKDKQHIYRIINQDKISDQVTQIARIKLLIDEYPDLIKISQKDNIITFDGVFVTQDLHGDFEAMFLGEFLSLNNGTTNPICTNGSASGGIFLLTDLVRPTDTVMKFDHYDSLSPLYSDIYKFRDKLLEGKKVLYTYMISFDDIDTNHNRVIDRPDKSVAEILDDMTDEYYRINYNNGIGMSSGDFALLRQDATRRQPIKNHINKTIRPYIKKFLEMMGVIDNLPVHTTIPMPHLTEENKKWIQDMHGIYSELLYDKFDHRSQEKYTSYVTDKLNTMSIVDIQKDPYIIYPLIQGDDELTMTRQITSYMDILIISHPSWFQNSHTLLGEMGKSELKILYDQIKQHIILPTNMDRGKIAYINLAQIIKPICEYMTFKNKLLTPTLYDIDDDIIGISDSTAQILDIHPTIWTMIKQNIVKESGVQTSLLNLSDRRTLVKIILDGLGFNSIVDSEGILQTRISDNYLNNNDEMQFFVNACQKLLDKSDQLTLSQSKKDLLLDLITQIKAVQRANDKKTPNFEQKRQELSHTLSELIDLSASSRSDNDLGTLLMLKVDDYNKQKVLFRYGRAIERSLGNAELNQEEVAFLQMITLKGHQLGQKDTDKAFKIYMSTFLISRGAMYDKISPVLKEYIYTCIGNLNDHKNDPTTNRKKKFLNIFPGVHLEDDNKLRYTDLIQEIKTQYNTQIEGISTSQKNYSDKIITYLESDKDFDQTIIPHYADRRKQKTDPEGDALPDDQGIYITRRVFDRKVLTEFNSYVTTTLPNNHLQSALIWFLLAGIGYGLQHKMTQDKISQRIQKRRKKKSKK